MTGRPWRRAAVCLLLLALAACGIRGDPVPPEPAAASGESG